MTPRKTWPDRRAIWRWHFYAGLLCAPIVMWLAVTGSIYLFRQQIEAAIDAPYASLAVSSPQPASARAAAAVAAIPAGRLSVYILPQSATAATQVLVEASGEKHRVYVHPETLQVLKSVREDDRFMHVIFRLHGELLAGDVGSAIVELAACWAVVLILTGLVLWWPANGRLAGVLWPRLGGGGRIVWRDLHAVTGFWVSAFALFLVLTGLPWAKFWGDYLKEVRQITRTADGPQDWTNGAARPPSSARAMAGHGDHEMHSMHHMEHGLSPVAISTEALDQVVAAAATLRLAPPVLVTPPARDGAPWRVRSDAANRPLRAEAQIDPSGAVLGTRAFNQRHPIDQAIGYGIAAHEGKLFGVANLVLSLATAAGLVLLTASAMVMWWTRRPAGVLGAPDMMERPRFSFALLSAVGTLAILFPLLGLSLAGVFVIERIVLRRIPMARDWLGLVR